MATLREQHCARNLDLLFACSYFVRILCEPNSCLSLQWTWNTNSQRCEFPQPHYSRPKGLHASAAHNLIFISPCTPKFSSLYLKFLLCSRWAPSSLLPNSSPFWDPPAAAFPLYFTSCWQSIWITAQVTVTLLPQEWGGRRKVTVQLTARKQKDHLGAPQINCWSVMGFFPTVCCSTVWEFGYGTGEITPEKLRWDHQWIQRVNVLKKALDFHHPCKGE